MKTSNFMNGWIRMKFRPDRLLLAILALMTTFNLPVTLAEEEELPSAELIDFLSAWETDEGEWADPELFEMDMFEQMSGYVESELDQDDEDE